MEREWRKEKTGREDNGGMCEVGRFTTDFYKVKRVLFVLNVGAQPKCNYC